MTCRNKFHIDHVEMDSEDAVNLRRKSCPNDFGYAEEPDYCTGNRLEDHCFECWERQIQTEGEPGVPIIKDSGNRRQFESGAVRDMQEGKGRCDLMPLEVVVHMLQTKKNDKPLDSIKEFMRNQDTFHLYMALEYFSEKAYGDNVPTMFLEVAKHFEEGAKKYGENNWQKGIPVNCYIDSAVRHYLKWLRGDKDEPHDRAFVWNLMCCIWEVDYRPKEDA